MTYLPGRSAASAMLPTALAMRMFWGMTVDYPFAMNASWMCPIIGFILFVPFALAIQHADRYARESPWEYICKGLPGFIVHALELMFVLLLLYDSAVVMRLLASSSNIIALDNITVHRLIFPLMLVAFIVIRLGGDAIGNSSRIWLRILPVLLLILFSVQIKSFRFGWLTPVFGGGFASILNGSIYCAGNMALLSLVWLISVPDRNKRSLFRYILFSSISVAILVLIQHLSFPSMINIPFTRAARIELILSNGRISLTPQLVLNVLWYGGLLYLLSTELVCSGTYLQRCFPRLSIWLIAVILSLAAGILAIFNPDWLQRTSSLMFGVFSILGSIVALLVLYRLLKKEKREAC